MAVIPSDSQMHMVVMDATFRIRGYRRQTVATVITWLLIILSAGTLGLLLLYWKRDWFLKLTHSVCSLEDAEVVYIKDAYGQKFVRKVRTLRKVRQHRFTPRRNAPPPGTPAVEDERPLHMYDDVGEDEEICEFRWFNYQRRKYWWESKSKTFKPLIGPNVVKRENIDTVRGMSEIDTQIRARLFGNNEIGVNIEPIIRILIMEALNPFYIFQIFSVLLWYLDDYYYFATCIVIMSSVSCAYTIVQTRAMQRMLRDRFETSGEVTVLRQSAAEASTRLSKDDGGERSAFEMPAVVSDQQPNLSAAEKHATQTALIPASSLSNLMVDENNATAENNTQTDDDTEFVTGSDLLDECRVIESHDGDYVPRGDEDAAAMYPNAPKANVNGSLLTEDDVLLSIDNINVAAVAANDAEHETAIQINNTAVGSVIPDVENADEFNAVAAGDIKPLRMPPSPLKRYGSFDPANRTGTGGRGRLGTGVSNQMPPPTPTSPFGVRDDGSDELYRMQTVSTALVPGDIFIIPKHGCEMFCDAVLLSGSCIVNESSLTGESVPVSKSAYSFDNSEQPLPSPGATGGAAVAALQPSDPTRLYYNAKNLTAKSTLFAGTTVVQTRYYGSEAVKAMVMRTGFNTVKGELVRSILYPKPVDFTFYREAYKFLLTLAGLASIGMVYSIVILTIFQRHWWKVVRKALDLITIVVPPALPLALTVGIVHAQARMKKSGLFCISPRMINMAGSVNIVCFDKTGTLTEEGLNIRGVVPVENGRLSKMVSHLALSSISPNQFSSTHLLSFDTHLLNCMATCHSLTLIDGKLCGDPLDLEMWNAIDWELEEPEVEENAKYDLLTPTVVRPKATTKVESSFTHEHLDDIGIVRVFTFESQLQRMSVVVKHIHDDRFHLYAKGSPEMIASLCLEDTVPSNFRAVLDAFTQDGDRVLALAHKTLQERRYLKIQRLPRHALESEMEFIGLLVFENRLKNESLACIGELRSANIRPVMVTGDNLLTALSVGRQCGIVDSSISVIEVAKDGGSKIKRHSVTPDGLNTAAPSKIPSMAQLNASQVTTTTTVLTPLKNDMQNNSTANNVVAITEKKSELIKEVAIKPQESEEDEEIDEDAIVTVGHYAVTGETFDTLKKRHPNMYTEVLKYGGIFARMSPAQKETLVEDLKHLGFYVGMCGDGANDCGALSAAHMGISLSDQEASAAATFTYKHANVSCVPTCIKEGRAALDASFGAFKFMAGYSLTQFITVLIFYWKNTNLSDFQFLYLDMFEITLISLVFGSTHAYPRLVKRAPPTRLLAFMPMFSLLSQVAFIAFAQLTIYWVLQFQPWYVPLITNKEELAAAAHNSSIEEIRENCGDVESECYFSYENFTVYTLSAFQYIWLAIAFSRGLPYRKIFLTNKMFLFFCVFFTVFNIYVTLYACSFLVNQLQLLMPPSFKFRLAIVLWAMANLVVAIGLEWLVVKYVRKKYEVYMAARESSSSSGNNKSVTVEASNFNNNFAPATFSPPASMRRRNTTSYSADQEKLELGDYTPTIGGARVVSIIGNNGTDTVVNEKQIPSSSGV